MAPEKNTDIEVKIPDEKDPHKEVVVELDDDNKVVKPAEVKKEEPRYVRLEDLDEKLKKSNAAYFAEQRKISQQLRDLTERIQPTNKVQTQKPDAPADEYDELVQKDWKQAVRRLSEERYQELRKEELERQKTQNEQQRRSELLETNKRKVMERHPDLEDPGSEKARIFQEIVSKNQDYLSDPFGPVLAMRDMEDELRSQGKIIDKPTQQIVEKELNRRTRTGAGAIPGGTQNGNSNKVVLTKEEREFCDHNGIKYESYAKNRRAISVNGGVQA